MKFPSIKNVAHDLRVVARGIDETCDVRLQVYPDGAWAIRVGLSDYDLDHRGFWGASCIPRGRFSATNMARELISQCRDHHAMQANR